MDISCLVCVLFFVSRGIWRGFVNEWSGLLGLALGYFAVKIYAVPFADWLTNAMELRLSSALLLSRFTVFLGAYLAIVLLGKLLTKVLKLVWLGWINRLAGGLSGLVKGVVFTSLLLAFYTQAIMPRFPLDGLIGDSWIYSSLISVGELLLGLGQDYLYSPSV
ncbi:MAG: CvpA family protein [Schleiferiaceae bacterium]|nr:CvpA family protein [Schleiferiaceae bacterium]